jgi:Acetyltransferase (GNAT) domain
VAEHGVIAETDRVVLRPWRVDEADPVLCHRRLEVAHWMGAAHGRPNAGSVWLIERDGLADDPRFGSWAVVELSTGVPAGSVLLKLLSDGASEIEIGWHLRSQLGRGWRLTPAAHCWRAGSLSAWWRFGP